MKLLKVLFVALLVLGLAAPLHAEAPASDNIVILGSGGSTGITPVTVVVPVRYGLWGSSVTKYDPTLASGTVVVWDTSSADGFTISACMSTNDATYAGVLVTDIKTADSLAFRRNTRNWGMMAVKGYCLASMDTITTAGQRLVPSGQGSSVGHGGAFTTADKWLTFYTTNFFVSSDIGTALKTTSAAGPSPVWLR